MAKLAEALEAAIQEPSVKEALEKLRVKPGHLGPVEFGKFAAGDFRPQPRTARGSRPARQVKRRSDQRDANMAGSPGRIEGCIKLGGPARADVAWSRSPLVLEDVIAALYP